jgi:hypothetical protein
MRFNVQSISAMLIFDISRLRNALAADNAIIALLFVSSACIICFCRFSGYIATPSQDNFPPIFS